MQQDTPDRLIWLDLEMTGLNPQQNVIIEIATIVTDSDLNELAAGPVVAIHQPEDELTKMDEWNQNQHGSSGLTERVIASTITCQQAEKLTLDFLRQHLPPGSSPLCGNSVCLDRQFLVAGMPQLNAFFHYRLLDVSSLKILACMWHPRVAAGVAKKSEHRALQDIRESIAELRHYRQEMLLTPK